MILLVGRVWRLAEMEVGMAAEAEAEVVREVGWRRRRVGE